MKFNIQILTFSLQMFYQWDLVDHYHEASIEYTLVVLQNVELGHPNDILNGLEQPFGLKKKNFLNQNTSTQQLYK